MCSSASWTPSLWLDLSLCLSRTLLLILLVNANAEVLGLGHQVLVLGEYGGAVPDLTISQPHGVLQLGGQGDLVFLKSTNCALTLLNLAVEVLGLNLELLFVESASLRARGRHQLAAKMAAQTIKYVKYDDKRQGNNHAMWSSSDA